MTNIESVCHCWWSLSPGTLFRSLEWSPRVLPDAHWLRLWLRPPVSGSWEPDSRPRLRRHRRERWGGADMQTPHTVNNVMNTYYPMSCLKPAMQKVHSESKNSLRDIFKGTINIFVSFVFYISSILLLVALLLCNYCWDVVSVCQSAVSGYRGPSEEGWPGVVREAERRSIGLLTFVSMYYLRLWLDNATVTTQISPTNKNDQYHSQNKKQEVKNTPQYFEY